MKRVFVVFLALCAIANAEGNVRAELEEAVSVMLAEEFEPIQRRLVEQGLAEIDAAAVTKSVVDEASRCMVDSLVDLAAQKDLEIEPFLSEAKADIVDQANGDFTKVLDQEELMRRLKICADNALVNSGSRPD